MENDYCILSVDWLNNQQAEFEHIITNDFKVTLENRKFNIDYYLKLYYYDLKDGDIDNSHNYDIIKEKTVKLSDGVNTISFAEPIIYLQSDINLIIKKVD